MSEQDPSGGVSQQAISSDADFLERVVQTDVGEEFKQLIGAEIDRSHALANRKDREVEVLKWKIRMRRKEFLALHPPKNSYWQDGLRKECVGDERQPLTDQQIQEIDRITDAAISLVTLGRNAKLQEEVSKITQVQVQQMEDNTDDEDGGAGNALGRIFG